MSKYNNKQSHGATFRLVQWTPFPGHFQMNFLSTNFKEVFYIKCCTFFMGYFH